MQKIKYNEFRILEGSFFLVLCAQIPINKSCCCWVLSIECENYVVTIFVCLHELLVL